VIVGDLCADWDNEGSGWFLLVGGNKLSLVCYKNRVQLQPLLPFYPLVYSSLTSFVLSDVVS